MARKKTVKKEVYTEKEIKQIQDLDEFVYFSNKIGELEKRIDRIVTAHESCRSLKGL